MVQCIILISNHYFLDNVSAYLSVASNSKVRIPSSEVGIRLFIESIKPRRGKRLTISAVSRIFHPLEISLWPGFVQFPSSFCWAHHVVTSLQQMYCNESPPILPFQQPRSAIPEQSLRECCGFYLRCPARRTLSQRSPLIFIGEQSTLSEAREGEGRTVGEIVALDAGKSIRELVSCIPAPNAVASE